MKVRVIRQFNDKTEGFITRPVNETYECSDERAEQLISGGFVEPAECSDERAEQLISGGFVEPAPDKPRKTKSVD